MPFVTGQRLTADALNILFAKPIGRLIQQSPSQALADATNVAITFGTGSTVYDTHSQHSESTNNTRITPLVAGYYEFRGTGFFETETSPVVASVNWRLNGATALAAAWRAGTASVGLQAFSGWTCVTVLMNGSTDYVELIMNQDSAGSDNTNTSVQFSSVVEWELTRQA